MTGRGRIPHAAALAVLLIACGGQTTRDAPGAESGSTDPARGLPTGGGGGLTASGGTSTGGSNPNPAGGGRGGSVVPGGCSLLPYEGAGNCVDCIIDNCCDEYDRCMDTCVGEFECLQRAVNEIFSENGTVTRAEQNQALDSCRTSDDDRRIVALFACLTNHEACGRYCLGNY